MYTVVTETQEAIEDLKNKIQTATSGAQLSQTNPQSLKEKLGDIVNMLSL